jgi:hypothetical protein
MANKDKKYMKEFYYPGTNQLDESKKDKIDVFLLRKVQSNHLYEKHK